MTLPPLSNNTSEDSGRFSTVPVLTISIDVLPSIARGISPSSEISSDDLLSSAPPGLPPYLKTIHGSGAKSRIVDEDISVYDLR